MIKQLLLFKFNKNVERAKIELFFKKYKALEKLDCLESVTFGENTSGENFDKGYEYGAIATLRDKNVVNIFLEHPNHVELTKKYLNPFLKILFC